MDIARRAALSIDLDKPSKIPVPTFIKDDANIIEFTLSRKGAAVDFETVGRIVVNFQRVDGVVISRLLEATAGTNIIEYMLGAEEMAKNGMANMELQLYSLDNTQRLSTTKFKVNVINPIGTNEIIETDPQYTTLQTLFMDFDERMSTMDDVNSKADLSYVDTELASVNEQLAQTAQKQQEEIAVRTPVRYGEIKLPSDFYPIDFKLYRKSDGKVYHNIDLEKRWRNNGITNTFYVNTDNGSDSNDGATEGAALRTPSKALQLVSSLPEGTKAKIVINGKMILRNEFIITSNTAVSLNNKSLIITTKDNKKIPVIGGDSSHRPYYFDGVPKDSLTWTLESGNVYRTTRSSTAFVVDITNRDPFTGNIKQMKKVNSLSECEENPGSYFIDGTTVYIHTFDSRPADGNLALVLTLQAYNLYFSLTNSTLFIENLEFFANRGLLVNGDIGSTLIINKTDFGENTFTNGLSVNNVGKVYNFNSSAHDTLTDGFNYHYANIPLVDRRNCFVFEYDCFGYNTGNQEGGSGNNFTTAHEGISTLRVGDFGEKSQGVVCADVNACYSVLIDCQMMNSKLPISDNRSVSYQFTTDIATDKTAKAVLINCSGVSPLWSIITDSPTELVLESWFEGLDKIRPNA